MTVRPKDYIIVDQHLYFAVVDYGIEQGRACCFLRYVQDDNGLHKLDTQAADALIRRRYPHYLFHSQRADIELHGIPLDQDHQHLMPEQTTIYLNGLDILNEIQENALTVISLLKKGGIKTENIGITGSLMLRNENATSDIDIVIYGRPVFFKARELIRQAVTSGQLHPLTDSDWQESYRRRACSFSFTDYRWHEQRKWNKCLSGKTKVDMSMLAEHDERIVTDSRYKKQRSDCIQARVTDASLAYDFPAKFAIDHDEIREVLVYTATYTGQAEKNERIEAAGVVEQSIDGKQRLVIGTSREAENEYIRVIENK